AAHPNRAQPWRLVDIQRQYLPRSTRGEPLIPPGAPGHAGSAQEPAMPSTDYRPDTPISTFIPISTHVSPTVLKTTGGDFMLTWQLGGLPFVGREEWDLEHRHRFAQGFNQELSDAYYRQLGARKLMQNELYLTMLYRPTGGRRFMEKSRDLARLEAEQR